MLQESKTLYKALLSRDHRFDGLFFVGVKSTGIYCRPVCSVKPPKEINCTFYNTAQEAELAGYRPCLRCRPELAPGNAPVDSSQRVAHLIVRRIEEGVADEEGAALEVIAREFDLSSRQIRRIIQKELGVPPIQLILTRRLLLAKQLLTETKLPVIEVAFASGFTSLRRFNDAFTTRYGMPPTRLRKQAVEGAGDVNGADPLTLQLAYRPPYDWVGVLEFLKTRELKRVEWVGDDFYARTVRLGDKKGWIRVKQFAKKNVLLLELSHELVTVLPALLNRVRDLFDLNARPDDIARQLRKDKFLAASVKANPGLRVPGAFNGFELGLRAILGQQVTVKAATTVACRFAEAFGESIVTPFPELDRLSPEPARIARASVGDIARLGVTGARAKSIVALAQAQKEFPLESGAHHDPDATIARLAELPGIGQWSAHYIAMRALRWPDAFPKEDIAVRKNLGGVTAREAEKMSQAWRPWRSYAVLHLWKNPIKFKIMKTNKNYVYKIMPTVLGKLKLIASDKGLAAILWENDKPSRVRLGAPTEDKKHPVLLQAERELAEYLAGKRKVFSVRFDPTGTPFQSKVWEALEKIPFGETCSYGSIAKKIGHEKAVRAVGAAIGRNPLSVMVPCHRVIGASGALTGFAGGLETKKFLLSLEGGENAKKPDFQRGNRD